MFRRRKKQPDPVLTHWDVYSHERVHTITFRDGKPHIEIDWKGGRLTVPDFDDARAILKHLDDEEARPTAEDLATVIAQGLIAFRFTREYVGEERLPEIEGWSWYDWTTAAGSMLSKFWSGR